MSIVASVVLAAGRGTRFQASGGAYPSKLVARFGEKPVVRHAVEAALDSLAQPVIVVTGHAREHVEAELADLPVELVHNPAFSDGLSTTLKAGIAAVPAQAAGVVVLLGDMPLVTAALIDRLVSVAAADDVDAVVPTFQGQRGNPVYLSRSLFGAVMQLDGDAGARHLLRAASMRIRDIIADDAATTLDIDVTGDLSKFSERDI